MEPTIALQTAADVITMLEFCWSLVVGDPAIDKLAPPAVGLNKAQDSLTVLQVVEQLRILSSYGHVDIPGGSKHEQELTSLVRNCSAEAAVLLRSLELQVSLEQGHGATEWHSFQPAWRASGTQAKLTQFGGYVTQYGNELGTWLVASLSDEKWAVVEYLRQLQKEAESSSSVRAREVVHLKKDILSALGHRSREETSVSKEARSRGPLKNTVHSSDSSGNESRQIRRAKPKKRLRHSTSRQASRATADTAASNTAVGLPAWSARVKKLLSALCHWIEAVPVEVRVLKHLVYESIDSREDSIREAQSGTFSWMLDATTTTDLQPHMAIARNSLIDWLRSGTGVFHVSGNAGSGKSTLMKYLRHHNRTRFELSEWAGERRLVFSSFYFWNSGSDLQMSLEGLYRSLLLEVCRSCPDLIPTLFPNQCELLSGTAKEVPTEDRLFGAQEIYDAFYTLLETDVSQKYRMCFFIDGLDEYTGDNVDYAALARSLRKWGEKEGVKLCVSARPYPEFLDIFDPSHRLHLHELTSQDIKKFATDSFERSDCLKLNSEDKLVYSIVRKSEGVFLWARVAIRSLIDLAKRGLDSLELLQSLESYPSDINELYDCILESLSPDERVRSNQMLLLASRNPFAQALNALCFSWIDDLDNPDFPRINRPYTTAAVSDRHANIRLELEHFTKGLLEMHTDRRERKDGDQFYRQRIQFFHRTARDYLRSPARLDQLKSSFGSSDISEIYSRLRLAEIVLAGKYKATKGADPRRRRMYFNYVRTLFGLRDEQGLRYQIPRRYLHALQEDLETTKSDKFSSSYAVSSYVSISNHNSIDEDPEKSASFLHFALSYGQHKFVIDELRENTELRFNTEELEFVLSAAFGNRRIPVEELKTLLIYTKSPLRRIRVKPSLENDPLASQSYQLSILSIFVSTLVFACVGGSSSTPERRSHSLDRKNFNDLFIILAHLLQATTADQNRDNSTTAQPLGGVAYLCLLHDTEPKDQNQTGTNHDILYTTLGQLVLRYAPTEAALLLPLLGETNTLNANLIGVEGLSSNPPLTARAVHWLSELGPNKRVKFVAHDHIDGHFCSKVMSAEESVAADDNLFFRIY